MPVLSRRLLLAAVAAICLAQESSLISPDVRRVGMRLACLCTSCKNTVGDCQMLHCHYSGPAREKIATLLKAGKSDDEAVATFVKDVGKHALSAPPTEGFSLTAWLMPGVFGLVGLGFIAWFLNREKSKALAPLPEIDRKVLDNYQARIEKEMADLE